MPKVSEINSFLAKLLDGGKLSPSIKKGKEKNTFHIVSHPASLTWKLKRIHLRSKSLVPVMYDKACQESWVEGRNINRQLYKNIAWVLFLSS